MTAWFRFFFLIPYLERRQCFGLVSFVINEISQPHPSPIYIKRISSNSLQVPFSCLLLTDCTPLVLGQLVHDQENLYLVVKDYIKLMHVNNVTDIRCNLRDLP